MARAEASNPSLLERLEIDRAWVDELLVEWGPAAQAGVPDRLRNALIHPLQAGGKRLRPILCRWVAEALGADAATCERAATALELLHTYSLVHDDLPAMDDDDLRRGQPTCHVAFDEATAILVGDGLQTLAFELLAGDPRAADLVGVLARASGSAGMVGGQALDLRPADREPGLDGVIDLHRRKTARLFAAACEMGAICGDGGAEQRAAAGEYGLQLGLAFQAIDDLLDVVGTPEELGKTPGKDAAHERPSLTSLLGLPGAREFAQEAALRAENAASRLGVCETGPLRLLPGALLERSS